MLQTVSIIPIIPLDTAEHPHRVHHHPSDQRRRSSLVKPL